MFPLISLPFLRPGHLHALQPSVRVANCPSTWTENAPTERHVPWEWHLFGETGEEGRFVSAMCLFSPANPGELALVLRVLFVFFLVLYIFMFRRRVN